ncbi:MAG: 2-oxoacid:ferredoxin oxidoreductase subunit beta [Candidatus Lokiarchaeota archaeon]|nr:2-oxoacid:ferredoxin oxidoreductase subunit beta [Candidatus Lokiarchaeota archaeon]
MAPSVNTFPNEKPEHPFTLQTMGGLLTGNFMSYFCGGCGYGIVGHLFNKVFSEAGLDPLLHPVVIGIGCYTQILPLLPNSAQSICTLHGRAPAIATGIKLANPAMKPFILTGDGDCLGIGGNHFIHLCRRNLDAVVLLFNNSIYGMTGGQVAPTTPAGSSTTTTFGPVFENRMDGVKLALAAGATYVARTTVSHPRTLMKYLKKAIAHDGTSVIEIVTPCVTYFGRKNVNDQGTRMDTGGLLMDWIKAHVVWNNQAKLVSDEELADKYVIGEFREENRPEYVAGYEKAKKRAMEG